MQSFLALQPFSLPPHCSAPSIAPHPLSSCPELSPVPSLLRRVGHMEPISLVTLKSRRCARLPPRRPRDPASRCAPVSRRSSRLATWPALKARAPLGARPARVTRSPTRALAERAPGFSSKGHRPAVPRAQDPRTPWSPRPPRPNKAWGGGGGGVGASASGPLPQLGGSLGGCRGWCDQDATGRGGTAPVGAQGPGPGHRLPRFHRARAPATAGALTGAHTGKCGVLSWAFWPGWGAEGSG
jgi:hypothetical protein